MNPNRILSILWAVVLVTTAARVHAQDNDLTADNQSAGVDVLDITPDQVVGGSTATATITYNYGGQSVHFAYIPVSVSSSHPEVAAVPATVTVESGLATLQIATSTVSSPHTVTITANANSFDAKTATLTVNPAPAPKLSLLTLNPTQAVGGATVQGSVKVDHVTAATGPVTVTLAGSVPGLTFTPLALTAMSSLPVSFSVQTPMVGSETMIVVTASGTAGERNARMKLLPIGFKFLLLEPASVQAGKGALAKLRLSTPAPGPLSVTLSAAPAGVVEMPSSIIFQAGEIEKVFKVMTSRRISRAVKVTVSATLPLAGGQNASAQDVLEVH